MGKKKASRAKKAVRAMKQAEPNAVMSDEVEWSHFEPEELKNAPHSFVIYRGNVGRYMKELMRDIRRVMEPYTASNLQMKKSNVLKDYVSIASYFHVSHLCILTRTQVSPYLKIAKIPRGPTLTFRILNYTLSRDVLSSLRKQVTFDAQFLRQPLLIMNNFSTDSKELDLVSKTFQNMFPSINVDTVRLAEVRRVLLVNYVEEDDTIELRHYTITFKTTGVSRGMKKILSTKNAKIPNLGRCTDIADFLNRGDVSESEAEDNTESVEVSHKMGVKVSKGLDEVGVKLVELGPRIKMQLIKIEEGMCDGEILYHKIVEKTPDEKLLIRQQRNLKKKLKMSRKMEQQENVQKKRKQREEHKQKCIRGMKLDPEQGNEQAHEADDDVDWYRKEVGDEPDPDTFSNDQRSRKPIKEMGNHLPRKFDKGEGSRRTRKFDRGEGDNRTRTRTFNRDEGSSRNRTFNKGERHTRTRTFDRREENGRKRKFDNDRGNQDPDKLAKMSKLERHKEKVKLIKKEKRLQLQKTGRGRGGQTFGRKSRMNKRIGSRNK